MDDRYQYQKWYVKLWRRRHYLMIPFVAFNIWRTSKGTEFAFCWTLATSLAQVKMKWHYSWSEIKKKFEKYE